MEMKDRLQALLIDKEITSARLAGVIGVQPSAISHILSGRNKPGFDLLSSLLREYPDVNPSWLMLGDGDMYIGAINTTAMPSTQHSDVGSNQNINKGGTSTDDVVTNVTIERGALIDDQSRVGESNNKGIDRVIVFYEDGTFKEYSNK